MHFPEGGIPAHPSERSTNSHTLTHAHSLPIAKETWSPCNSKEILFLICTCNHTMRKEGCSSWIIWWPPPQFSWIYNNWWERKYQFSTKVVKGIMKWRRGFVRSCLLGVSNDNHRLNISGSSSVLSLEDTKLPFPEWQQMTPVCSHPQNLSNSIEVFILVIKLFTSRILMVSYLLICRSFFSHIFVLVFFI